MSARCVFAVSGRVVPVLVAWMAFGSAGAALAQGGPPADAKIVYVNVQQVVQSAPGAAEARATFDQELVQFRSELQSMTTAIDSLVKEYQRQEVMLSPQAKTDKQQEILEKQQQLNNRQTELEAQAEQRQQELLQPILERINGVIEQVRAENGYDMVLDVAGAGIVAADTRLDITSIVNQRVQALDTGSTGE
jgi:outer membrane protein